MKSLLYIFASLRGALRRRRNLFDGDRHASQRSARDDGHIRGFTLVEVLVVISLIGIIGTLVVAVLSITLRGSQKADVIAVTRQNGNLALSQMTKQIRFAKSIDSPSSCIPSVTSTSITITSFTDGDQTTFACPTSLDSGITSNSASLMDANAVSVESCSFICSQANSQDPPTVTIEFTLIPFVENQFTEAQTSLPFQTSVTMRNFNR